MLLVKFASVISAWPVFIFGTNIHRRPATRVNKIDKDSIRSLRQHRWSRTADKCLPTFKTSLPPREKLIHAASDYMLDENERRDVPLKGEAARASLTTTVSAWNLYCRMRDALPAEAVSYARKRFGNTACLASIRSSRGCVIAASLFLCEDLPRRLTDPRRTGTTRASSTRSTINERHKDAASGSNNCTCASREIRNDTVKALWK